MSRPKTISLLLLGVVLSTVPARSLTLLVPEFPAPRPQPSEALALVQCSLGYPNAIPSGTVVELIWTTAEAVQSRHPKSDRSRWLNATEEWSWFVTRFDPQPPSGPGMATPVRVDRVRTNGSVEAGLPPLATSLSLTPALAWDTEHLPIMSPIDAISRALTSLHPEDPHHTRTLVGASWSTAARFRPHLTDGTQYHWDKSEFEWAWFVTLVRRDTTRSDFFRDEVLVLRVRSDGTVQEAGRSRT
jgi:hypothetical protein